MGKKRVEEELEKRINKKKKRRLMGCCENEGGGVRKGAWSSEEDKILVDFITKNGHGTWRNLPKLAGLLRCGKSCRLRWTNYLRPDIKRGPFTPEEENTIIHLHSTLGNKWAAMATHLPGRTDNDIKNFWNSHLRKRFGSTALNQSSSSSSKQIDMNSNTPLTRHMAQWESVKLEADSRLSTKPLLLNTPSSSKAKGDYFLSLWNSEVGDSFRNVNKNTSERDASESPNSETSSLTKAEPDSKGANHTGSGKMTDSPVIANQKTEIWETKKEVIDEIVTYSDMTRPCEFEDSSDAMLKLLLDFPVGGNDMGFLEGPFNDVSTYAQDHK